MSQAMQNSNVAAEGQSFFNARRRIKATEGSTVRLDLVVDLDWYAWAYVDGESYDLEENNMEHVLSLLELARDNHVLLTAHYLSFRHNLTQPWPDTLAEALTPPEALARKQSTKEASDAPSRQGWLHGCFDFDSVFSPKSVWVAGLALSLGFALQCAAGWVPWWLMFPPVAIAALWHLIVLLAVLAIGTD